MAGKAYSGCSSGKVRSTRASRAVLRQTPEAVQAGLGVGSDAGRRLALQVQRPHVERDGLGGEGARRDDDAQPGENGAQVREHRRGRRVVDGDRDALPTVGKVAKNVLSEVATARVAGLRA
jgi:hypothetical protein